MPKKQVLDDEQQRYEDYKRELEAHFAGTIVQSLMSRDDVVAVFIPSTMKMKAPRGAMVVTMSDGSSVKARFVVDEAFAAE